MNALSGLINPAAIGQQVQGAFQAGQQQKRETETRNALASLVADPGNQEALGALAQHNPQAAMQMQDRNRQIQADQQKQQQEQMKRDLTARAVQGDDEALTELANLDFDRWKAIDARQKDEVLQESQVLGNAALGILNLPPQQRAGAMMEYAKNMPQYAQEIGYIAQLPPDQQEAALRSAVFEAKMTSKLHEMERPSYQRLAPGEVLVNTKDQQAVGQFAAGGQQQYTEGQVATNPQTGERLIMENGQWVPIDAQGNRLVSDAQFQQMGGI